jgi:hypothetical protein
MRPATSLPRRLVARFLVKRGSSARIPRGRPRGRAVGSRWRVCRACDSQRALVGLAGDGVLTGSSKSKGMLALTIVALSLTFLGLLVFACYAKRELNNQLSLPGQQAGASSPPDAPADSQPQPQALSSGPPASPAIGSVELKTQLTRSAESAAERSDIAHDSNCHPGHGLSVAETTVLRGGDLTVGAQRQVLPGVVQGQTHGPADSVSHALP